MSDEIADFLDATADVLEKDGWTQQTFHDDFGRHCAVGGMMKAAGSLEFQQQLLLEAQARYAFAVRIDPEKARGDSMMVITGWNDTVGRTQQEVLDALRLAAKEQRMPHE